MSKINVFWYRRDLRVFDNAGLYHALKSENPVLSVFIFDTHILNDLKSKEDPRVTFIHQAILAIQEELKKLGSSILVKYGQPVDVWKSLVKEFTIGDS